MNIDHLTQYLLDYHNPEQAIQMEGYLKNQFKCIGLKASKRRRLFKDYIQNHENFKIENLLEESQKIWESPYREMQYIYLDFLIKNKRKLERKDFQVIEKLIVTKSWWDTVDMLSTHVIGTLFKKYPKLYDKNSIKWQDSNNIWLKRSLILFQLKYKDKTDIDILRRVIEDNLGTEEFFINKAIGWALREYSKTNPEWVISFVKTHNLTSLSKRESLKYLKKIGRN